MKLRWLVLLLALLVGTADARSCRNPTDVTCYRQCIASTADTSGNGRTAYAIGVKPQAVSAPLAGSSFDGIRRGPQSSGMNAGVTGFGVQTSDGSMELRMDIRRSRTGVQEVLAGKYKDAPLVGEKNYVLFIDSNDKLNLFIANSAGSNVVAVGTTSLAAGVNYNVRGLWTGSVLEVRVNAAQEGTTPAITALEAPDAVVPFTIGGTTFNSAEPTSPQNFEGVIANVEMYRGGVLQGAWTLASLACP